MMTKCCIKRCGRLSVFINKKGEQRCKTHMYATPQMAGWYSTDHKRGLFSRREYAKRKYIERLKKLEEVLENNKTNPGLFGDQPSPWEDN